MKLKLLLWKKIQSLVIQKTLNYKYGNLYDKLLSKARAHYSHWSCGSWYNFCGRFSKLKDVKMLGGIIIAIIIIIR